MPESPHTALEAPHPATRPAFRPSARVRGIGILDVLGKEHRRHRYLLSHLADILDEPGRRRRCLLDLFADVVSHHAAEEQVLYSALVAQSETHEPARDSVLEHMEVDELIEELLELDGAGCNERQWRVHFFDFRAQAERHMLKEERWLFPHAHRLLSVERQMAMATEFYACKAQHRWQAMAGIVQRPTGR